MAAGTVFLGALKAVGAWVLSNPHIALNAVDKVAKIQSDKKTANTEEQFQIVDEKLNQVGAAALELEERITTGFLQTNSELEALRKETRTLKKALYIMGATVGALIIAVVLIAIF